MCRANRGGRSEEWPQFKTDSLVALDEWPAQRALIGKAEGCCSVQKQAWTNEYLRIADLKRLRFFGAGQVS